MKKILFTVFAVWFGFLFLPGSAEARLSERLTFADGAFQALLTWERGPVAGRAESVLRLDFSNELGAPVDPGHISVELWMPDMGHGAPPTQVQRVIEQDRVVTGAYRVRNVYFVMDGVWDVRFHLKYRDGLGREKTETKILSLRL